MKVPADFVLAVCVSGIACSNRLFTKSNCVYVNAGLLTEVIELRPEQGGVSRDQQTHDGDLCVCSRVDGAGIDVIADGDNVDVNWAAASSGGAIWIICRKFSGSAATSLLSAKGGDGAGVNSSVPAAGGRIAVWTNYKVGKLSDRQFAELLSGGLGEAVVLDALPDWAGTASAVAGGEYTKSACTPKVITPAGNGTIAWLKLLVNSGLILLVR